MNFLLQSVKMCHKFTTFILTKRKIYELPTVTTETQF